MTWVRTQFWRMTPSVRVPRTTAFTLLAHTTQFFLGWFGCPGVPYSIDYRAATLIASGATKRGFMHYRSELAIPHTNMRSLLLLITITILAIVPAFARSSERSRSSRSHSSSARCSSCARDTRGRIKRNPQAKNQFRRGHPCPATGRTSGHCPGYVIDHVRALKHGGADDPSNMQWQTIEAAKAKDRVED